MTEKLLWFGGVVREASDIWWEKARFFISRILIYFSFLLLPVWIPKTLDVLQNLVALPFCHSFLRLQGERNRGFANNSTEPQKFFGHCRFTRIRVRNNCEGTTGLEKAPLYLRNYFSPGCG